MRLQQEPVIEEGLSQANATSNRHPFERQSIVRGPKPVPICVEKPGVEQDVPAGSLGIRTGKRERGDLFVLGGGGSQQPLVVGACEVVGHESHSHTGPHARSPKVSRINSNIRAGTLRDARKSDLCERWGGRENDEPDDDQNRIQREGRSGVPGTGMGDEGMVF